MPSRRTVVLVSLLMATPVIIFWLWLVILPPSVAILCPEKCRCTEQGLSVNCSRSGLNSIPSILPKHILVLSLDGNNIPFFAKDNFLSKGLVHLETIRADSCKIKTIEVGAFNGLPELTKLSMNSNEITQITPGTFENISHLEYLNLAHNRFDHLGVDVFYGLIKLKHIYLQGNKLQYVHPDTFKGLQNLQNLLLSKNSGLQMPTNRQFINSHSLKHLAISGCNISSVSVDTFANVTTLEQLDLSYNYLRSVDFNILKVLPNVSYLNLGSNEITEITPGTCEKISPLEYLYLQYNMIEHLEIDVFCGLVNLKHIYLQGNNLQYLHPDTFIGLPNLQVLFLSNNSGLQMPTDRHFTNSLSLKELAISGCNISSVSVDTFANVSALEQLDLSYNYLRSIDFNILKVLPNLSHLYLGSNEITEITPDTCEKIRHLEHLSLEYNMIENLEIDVFCGLVNLKYIYLYRNNLQYLHPDTFVNLPNLQSLFLSENSGLQIPTDRQFINSLSLKELKISGCNISSVSVETFANITALERLDLSYNSLKNLDISILKTLPQLSTLYLYGNPLQCDCQLQKVRQWCQDNNIQTAYDGMVQECYTPSEVKGKWWGVLEKGQCLQGIIHYYGDYKNIRYRYTHIKVTDTNTNTYADVEEETKRELITEKVKWKQLAGYIINYQLPICAILFIFGTTGNVIIIIIITCNKDMRTVPNMYILNLAISDIIYLMVLFSETLPHSAKWLRSDISCIYFPFCFHMSISLTAYSIAVLGFQRYRVTVYPLHARFSSQPTWRVTGATICGLWIVAALFAIPSARRNYLCSASIIAFLTNYYRLDSIFRLLVSCILPLCVIAFFYIMMSCHLLKSRYSLSEETQNARLNTRKNTTKVMVGLTLVFLFSYLPFQIFETYLFSSIDWDNSITEITKEIKGFEHLFLLKPLIRIFLSINSCLNPVALFCTSLAFRRHFKRYLTCCCKSKSPHTDLELKRRN